MRCVTSRLGHLCAILPSSSGPSPLRPCGSGRPYLNVQQSSVRTVVHTCSEGGVRTGGHDIGDTATLLEERLCLRAREELQAEVVYLDGADAHDGS